MSFKDRYCLWWDKNALGIRRRARWVGRVIGRRGAYLLWLALLDILFGYSLIVDSATVGIKPDLFLGYTEWAVAWMLVGVICLWQAFVRLDRLAFSLAVTIKILWGITAIVSWGLTQSNPRGWVSGVIFIAFGVVTGIVSYWPEHHRFPDGRD